MLSTELRTRYLQFFETKGHLIHASDSLVPDDPTLLYTSAGMVQFKPFFVGERVPPSKRIVTSQKCLRTDDVDEVGDAVHHTFFEMLGNFSFGDYFKRDAIIWAWEFLTDVLKLDPNNIWTSIYLDDDEAAEVWVNEVKFPQDRIVRLGEDKNYWPANAPSAGPNGPCGPCNEIFVDVTPELGPPEDPTHAIACDGNRFVEVWNLVFTQFDRLEDGTMKPLPAKNIDTGMGLERTAAVLQGTPTDYETDLFLPIIKRVEAVSGAKYGSDDDADKSIRVIADHIRGAVFAIADGVMPSNVGRGYVLRRIIRNAVVKGRRLGLDKTFVAPIVPVVVEIMGEVYHEVADRQAYVEKVIDSEEEKFRRTLESGMQRLEDHLDLAVAAPDKKLEGDVAFTLYDTYGFPLELTRDIAAERGVSIDADGFDAAMEEQRARAKEASDIPSGLFGDGATAILELEKTIEPTRFVGYDQTEADAVVQAILKGGELVSTASEGDSVDVVLDLTPFYAETGGQVGDTGEITSDGARLEVCSTVKASHFFMHEGKLTSGLLTVGDKVRCTVDAERRLAIARHHTATHLLHAALHKVLGEHALQSGSVVEPDRLRFDFSHFQAVTPDEMRRIEDEVNLMILNDLPAETLTTDLQKARQMGATALFGEKYGDQVRVVKMGDESIELCGGTHLCHTSQVGLFKLTSESSIGAGVRRIEAVAGEAALRYIRDLEDQLHGAAKALGAAPSELVSAAERTAQAARESQKQIDRLKSKGAAETAAELADSASEAGGARFVTASIPTTDVPTLQKLADGVADRLESAIVVLAGTGDGKVLFVAKVTADLAARGFHAGDLVREVAQVTGGSGGGKPEFARAGGKDASTVDEALGKAAEISRTRAEAT